ncbi:hypothetical protein [Streptomyces sp. NPDC001380]|uniref:hypothetical protein n=1 Tax=Streptomyces sp. NPDC001380 TaxID=3364566 RepID=UPI00368128BD
MNRTRTNDRSARTRNGSDDAGKGGSRFGSQAPRRPGTLSAAGAEGGTRGVLGLPRRPHPGRTVPLLSL